MILADTSVWIDHLRRGDREMRDRLGRGEIAIHPFVIAELALGSLRERRSTLALLDFLPQVRVAQMSEVRVAIENYRLYSMGIGLTDAHLVAAVFIDPAARLWTRDKALGRVAEKLGIGAGLD